jgi:hypothetical protein
MPMELIPERELGVTIVLMQIRPITSPTTDLKRSMFCLVYLVWFGIVGTFEISGHSMS